MKFAMVTFRVPCSVKESNGRDRVMRKFTTIVVADGKTTKEIVDKASGDLMLAWHEGRHIEDSRSLQDQIKEIPDMDMFYKDVEPLHIVITDTPVLIS